MIEHCVLAFNDFAKEKVYREYVTDALMYITETVANSFGGTYIQRRYADIMDGVQEEEEMSADEIVLDIIKRADLRVSNGNI